jgi:hypothetical protein
MGVEKPLPARTLFGIEQCGITGCEVGVQARDIVREPEMDLSWSLFSHSGSLGERRACVMEF